ncbi:MAG: TonB-dependent receptor plug domain-containing protein, partial [Pseudomonadota bacterium]
MSSWKTWLTGSVGVALAVSSGGVAAQVEEVIVTGIRGSLERAVDIKENAGSIVDAISAEDIADFPDTNVAESLARITGVAITRTRGGEGQFVTVRGLGEEFNAVTYNGRLLATENNGREFSFDVIASELISGAEVYKSSEARLGDGSLGGRVNIRSAKPLSRPGFHATGSVSGQYEGLAESTGLRATGVVSNTWADDTFGIIASVSYQQRDARTDIAESTFLIPDVQVDANGLVNGALDADGDGLNDTTGAAITNTDARFNGFAPSVAFTDRRRIGSTLAFQWQP